MKYFSPLFMISGVKKKYPFWTAFHSLFHFIQSYLQLTVTINQPPLRMATAVYAITLRIPSTYNMSFANG
jgi:hypothetical protein